MSPENTTHITVMFVSASGHHPATSDPLRISALLRDTVETAGGRLLKTLGDQYLCVFSAPEWAAQASGHLFEAEVDGIRVGDGLAMAIHEGYVVVGPDDVFGQAVVTAARLVNHARLGQTLATAPTLERMGAIYRAAARPCESTMLKGLDEPVEIHEMVWDQQAATLMRTDSPQPRQTIALKMSLDYTGKKLILDHETPAITVGRSSSADITVDEELASRHHAVFEFRQTHFYLRDQSTNGTFLHTGRYLRFLRRDEVPLTGTGRVRLGRPFDAAHPDAEIRFEVHAS